MSNEELASLEELSKKFRHWRSNYNRKPYPSSLWDAACSLTQNTSVAKVADYIGVERAYLKRKMRSTENWNRSPFVQVLPKNSLAENKHIKIRISRDSELTVAMQFEGSLEEALSIIKQLF